MSCPVCVLGAKLWSSCLLSKNLPMASLSPARQAQGTLGTEEVPGSFLLDILLLLASLLAKHSREAQPSTSSLQWELRHRPGSVGGEGQTLHNPTLWPEHLENKMLASTPVSAWGRSQTAHQTEGACHSPKGEVFRMPSTGDQNLTRVSASLLDWEGALFSQEKRGIV